MAEIVVGLKECLSTSQDEVLERISIGLHGECHVVGKEGTFCCERSGEDAIASIGYACDIDCDSMHSTLLQILNSFEESKIADLKRRLVGQYVLLIKKGNSAWLFADFMGARNVFYSDDGLVACSSLSRMECEIGTTPADLDPYKVGEFLAVKHVLYPAWLGSGTVHKRIKLLYPYEYLAIDTEESRIRVGSLEFSLDNRKQSDPAALSDDLSSALQSAVYRPEFRDLPVAASLSGGRDSRLVGAVVTEYYSKARFRIAVAAGHHDSLKDMEIAKAVSKLRGVPLDVYRFKTGRDETRFQQLTEGMAPAFNNKLAPLLDDAGSYALGFGGVFGTELFMPLPWKSIDEFVSVKVGSARKALKVEEGFWRSFEESMREEFRRLKRHYSLDESDERDYIRLYVLLDTARYASFIMAAFNHSGLQIEPYGTYAACAVALQVSPSLWGNHRRFGGDARIQLAAMSKINQGMARVLTYKNFRPMMPLSVTSFPRYVWGAALQAKDVLRRKLVDRSDESIPTDFPLGRYLGGDWAESFFRRTNEKYGMPFHPGSVPVAPEPE